jgi:tetratricopeptide (TPR) repeat protein
MRVKTMSRRTWSPLAKRPEASSQTVPRMLAEAVGHGQAGRLAEAERICRQILELDAQHADSLHLLGVIAYQTGHHEASISLICKAIVLGGKEASYYFNLGNSFRAHGKRDNAVECYRIALTLKTDYAEAHHGLGNELLAQGKPDEAAECYERAIALRTDYAEAYCNLGNVFLAKRQFDQAFARYHQALVTNPDFPEAHNNLGVILQHRGNLDEAIAQFKRALVIKPDYADAYNNLGASLQLKGAFEEAVAQYRQALALKPDYPDAHWNSSLIQLLLGDFATGLPNLEWRWRTVCIPRNLPQPPWRGEPLHGARILIHAEQGLGDTLQFLRYVPMVQRAGGSVVLEVQAPLRRIAAELPGITTLVTAEEPLPPFEWTCPLMSLPLAFGTTPDTIPAQTAYLSVPDEALRTASSIPWPTTGLRVGLVWAGNPMHPRDQYRSIPLPLLEPLLRVDGVHFFSLQMGPAAGELAAARAPITDLSHAIHDMADTAALMTHLDLLIAVDTAVAHLAGALGKQVWTLLPFSPDWRWLLHREDSPWYPTMRLFRQPEFGDWQAVVQMAAAALAEQCSRDRASRGLNLTAAAASVG